MLALSVLPHRLPNGLDIHVADSPPAILSDHSQILVANFYVLIKSKSTLTGTCRIQSVHLIHLILLEHEEWMLEIQLIELLNPAM